MQWNLRPGRRPARHLAVLRPAAAAASTLRVCARVRPLDQLTTGQLRPWLRARHARWPATANPYLLINRSTAGGVKPVSRGYIQDSVRRAGITAADLRADRLLAEAHATSGDPLRLTHLFGISDPTAIRYCTELEPPMPPGRPPQAQSPRTR